MAARRRTLGAVSTRSGWFRGVALVYLALAVLGPWLNVGTVRGIRPEEIVLLALVAIYLIDRQWDVRFSKPVGLVLAGFAAVAVCISLSLLANIPRSAGGPVARDTLELVRVAKYALIVVLAAHDGETARVSRRWFIALVLVATAIAFVQVLAPPGWVFKIMSKVDPSSAKFYASQNIALGLRRVTGSFGNPNNFGVFLSASAVLLLGLLAVSSKRGESWFLGSALVGVCAAVVATQSFTDLFALGAVLLVGCVVLLFQYQYRKRALTLLVVVAAIAATLAASLGIFGSGGFVVGKRLTNARYAFDTMRGRFKVWTTVALSMADDPAMLAFGMGPQKESETHIVGGDIDSDYITILKRYGIVGLVGFGLFMLFTVEAIRLSAAHDGHMIPGWRIGALLMLLVVLICDLANVVYVNNQLMDVFMFVLGCVLESEGSHPLNAPGRRGSSGRSARSAHLPHVVLAL